ncbi:MAG: hypothetical protein H8E10_16255 [Desulfobacterales bacterium]|nr:hypothetical protein [Desulfobacterales bacterium]
MKGSEEQVLKIIRELGSCKIERIGRKMSMTAEYAGEVCKNLLDDGFLSKTGPAEYALSPRGERAVNRTLSRGPIGVLRGA